MSQQNTTQNSAEYILPRGRMFIGDISSTTGKPDSGLMFIGNCPEVTFSSESEVYDHYRSTSALKFKDISAELQLTLTGTAVLESVSKETLAMFFSGSHDSTFINPAITGFADQVLVADGEMVSAATGGRWYFVMDADGNIANSITATNAIELKSTNATPVTLTEDTDYVVDKEAGRVFFLDTSPIQTIISGAEGVTCSLTADATALASTRVNAGTGSSVSKAIVYETLDSLENDMAIRMTIHKGKITPNGDANFVSDEVMQLPISIAVEQSDYFDQPIDIDLLR